MQGVVFDFNGTLFRDSAYHETAWHTFISQETDRVLTKQEFEHHVHGVNNHGALEYIFNKKLDKKTADELAERKEKIYRDMVVALDSGNELVEGAEEYLDFLTERKIPITIATASMKNNVDFYFDFFKLDRWFDYDKVVYNDGDVPSKPAPDFYLLAAKNIQCPPEEVIVFEDSVSGIRSAFSAKVGAIWGVSTDGNNKMLLQSGVLAGVIDDYHDKRIYEQF
ncbi:HAD family phosphatase [Enterococcus sp. 669A]|uniref:HAD family phosphatase n=1 Tax=Candidatus Enterococcus moelleringii TaxID=2815325 RepID=A0ABS3LFW9_9ENTE|nr:HAD family phosphatase [Enterococcus sp. 669A]MBO1308525.1 HAD family phosphatase [Enterococcus sp. 669A]